MFYAARSGKQHLAFECLENRHLLSADFGAVDFHDDLAKQSPAPVVITMAPTAQTAGQVEPFEEFKGKATASYGDHHPQHLTTHFDIFESDGLEGDDVGQDDLESRLEQTPILSLMTIQLAQISHSEIQSLNAPSLIIELGVFKVTPAQQVSIDYAQNDSDAGEVDEIEIDDIFLIGIQEPPVVVANKASSPNAVATSSHSVSNNTANFAVLIETATTQADETVASEQNASNLEMKSDRGRLPTSSPVVDGANPSQQPSTLSLLDSEPATIAPEYAPVLDAPLGEATVINANSSPDNIAVDNAAVDNAARDDSPAASGSVKELLTDVVAKVVPATGAVISAGLSGDYEAIDLAMSQLLHDLDTVRTDATLLLDESTLRGLASAAMLGVIAAEIVRRRRVGKERLHQATFEEHLAIWMYPECSGVSGGPSR